MGEPITRHELEARLRLRLFFRDSILPKLNSSSDVIMLHCPWDLVFFGSVHEKTVVLYDHFAVRPLTFMFNKILQYIEPLRAEVLKKDRGYVLGIHKELYGYADLVLTNSKFIQGELWKWFKVNAKVCHPPVNLRLFKPVAKPSRNYFLSVQRVHWQKRIETQIEAFKGLKEKLLIVGGPRDKEPNQDLLYLASGSSNIKVLGGVSRKKLINLMANAKAVIQTGFVEDFGLVVIQSFSCGTPVICVNEGGFRETVHNKQLGRLLNQPYVQNLREAILNCDVQQYDANLLRAEAKKYGFSRFRREIQKHIEAVAR